MQPVTLVSQMQILFKSTLQLKEIPASHMSISSFTFLRKDQRWRDSIHLRNGKDTFQRLRYPFIPSSAAEILSLPKKRKKNLDLSFH